MMNDADQMEDSDIERLRNETKNITKINGRPESVILPKPTKDIHDTINASPLIVRDTRNSTFYTQHLDDNMSEKNHGNARVKFKKAK
jgi:hypothetical protein